MCRFFIHFLKIFLATTVGTGKRGKPKGYTSIMVQKPRPWGRRKKRRGRWANRDKEQTEEYEVQEEEMPFMSMDLAKRVSNGMDEIYEDDQQPLSEIDIMIKKGLEKLTDEMKQEFPSSNVSEDSRSSFNDKKSKDSNMGSPSSSSGSKLKCSQNSNSTRGNKRERDWDTSIESDGSDAEAEYVKLQKKQRRPKTRKLASNPLFWTVDDVFEYLRKTPDCKELAYRVRQEVSYLKTQINLYALRIFVTQCFNT